MEQEAVPGGAGCKRRRCGAEERGRPLARQDSWAWEMEEEEEQAMHVQTAETEREAE